MEPAVRVELTTGGLRNRCSTTELRWHSIANLQVLTLGHPLHLTYYMRRSGRGKGKEVLAGGFEPPSEAAVPYEVGGPLNPISNESVRGRGTSVLRVLTINVIGGY
jgi:hypothetical protein